MCMAVEEEQKEVRRFFPNLFPGGLPAAVQSLGPLHILFKTLASPLTTGTLTYLWAEPQVSLWAPPCVLQVPLNPAVCQTSLQITLRLLTPPYSEDFVWVAYLA